MPSANQRTSDTYRDLRALEAIEQNPNISQRELARSMGVALGVANACVRTLVRKGSIKIRGESNRSITYHVTKEGRLQKARLAMEWTGNTIDYYIQARSRLQAQLHGIALAGMTRIALCGADEASELVAVLAPQAGIEIVGIYDIGDRRIADTLAGIEVSPLSAAAAQDCILLCPTPPSAQDLDRIIATVPGCAVVLLSGEILTAERDRETT